MQLNRGVNKGEVGERLREIAHAAEQRCWNHRIVNLLSKVPKKWHQSALLMLRQIAYAESRQEAERLKKVFQHWCRQKGLRPAADLIDCDWE